MQYTKHQYSIIHVHTLVNKATAETCARTHHVDTPVGHPVDHAGILNEPIADGLHTQ